MRNKIKRIVMVTPDIQIDRRIILEAKSLIDTGKEVILIAGNDGKMPEFELFEGIKIRRPLYSGVDSRILWLIKFMNISASCAARIINHVASVINKVLSGGLSLITLNSGYDKFLADIIHYYRPDAVHAHDLPVLASGAIAAGKNNVPLIYDSHELYTEEELPLMPKLLLKVKERFFIRKSNVVITVNPYLKKELESRYSVNNIVVVENATRRNKDFRTDKKYDLFRKELNLPAESRLILYQGWFSPHRNLATLVTGMKHLEKNYYLLLMGYGDYINELKLLAEKSGVQDRAVHVAAKSQDELLYYTSSADIGVMPYLRSKNLNNLYSSPNKLYEFIAAGLPILANDLPYYNDMIGKYHNGLIRDLESPQLFADAVKEIFSMDLNRLRLNSLKAYEDLNWDKESKKVDACYKRLES